MKKETLYDSLVHRAKNNKIIAFLILLLVVLSFLIVLLKNFLDLKSKINEDKNSQDVTTVESIEKGANQGVDYVIQTTDDTEISKPMVAKLASTDKDKIVKLRLVNKHKELIEAIRVINELNLTTRSPDFIVEITTSGEVKELSNGLFVYSGGVLQLVVNSDICYVTDYKIQRSDQFGNSYLFVKGKIEKQVNEIISSHLLFFKTKIQECIS